MDQWKLDVCKIHSKLPVYGNRLHEANLIIKTILSKVISPYVAFSCGKDSSVLAHMVLQFDNSIPLRFLSSGETRLIHDVDRIINYFRNMGADIREINIDRVFSDEWKDASWNEERKAGRGDMMKLNIGDWDCIFMGLRMEESRVRKISLLNMKSDDLPYFCYRYIAGNRKDMIRCCPLSRWTTEDIGAYIVSNNLPWLEWYDYKGFEGRTTARLTGDAVRQNVLTWIKKNEPDKWNILRERFPEFGLFV